MKIQYWLITYSYRNSQHRLRMDYVRHIGSLIIWIKDNMATTDMRKLVNAQKLTQEEYYNLGGWITQT